MFISKEEHNYTLVTSKEVVNLTYQYKDHKVRTSY